MKISYFLNSRSGYGHIARMIAFINQIGPINNDIGITELEIFASEKSHNFLSQFANQYEWIKLSNLIYRSNFNDSIHNPKDWLSDTEMKYFINNNPHLYDTNLPNIVITDWLKEALYYTHSLSGNSQPLSLGVYHSNIWKDASDNRETNNWKDKRQLLAKSVDIMLHIYPFRPIKPYPNEIQAVTLPLVARSPVLEKKEIYSQFGFSSKFPLILVYYGVDSEDRQYPYRQNLVDILLSISISYNIIYVSQNNIYRVQNKEMTKIIDDSYLNGQDLVNIADIVIAKPGMSIISEILMLKKPYILLPYTNVEQWLKVQLLEEITEYPQSIIDLKTVSTQELTSNIEWALKNYVKIYANGKPFAANGPEMMAKLLKLINTELNQNIFADRSVFVDQLYTKCKKIEAEFWRNTLSDIT